MTALADATDPRFTGAQPDHLARFEAAVAPPEVTQAVIEEVARAIAEAEDAHGPFYFPCQCGWEAGFGAGWEERGDQHRLTSIATAAVAAYRAQDGGAEEAVRRVEALADHLDGSASSAYRKAAAGIRAALAPQAGAGQ